MLRSTVSLLLILAFISPTAVLADKKKAKKYFKEGMKQEATEAWDKAAEQFALAVSESPKNPEYKLHLQRSLFSASQMYMRKGAAAAKEKDYEGGYNAFRKAYAYDPTNELAKAEMDHMVRLQQGENPASGRDEKGNLRLVPTSYNKKNAPLPQKLEKLRDVPFPGGVNLQFLVKELAKDLDLNVLFDTDSRLESRQVKIDLRNVSAAQALDYVFLQENLFFQKVGPRTILVATNTRRANFQQLVLRTFYLQNADPTKIKPLIQQAIPAQPGRSQTIVMEDSATNSITIRDTEENIRLIGRLIGSLDKDRAEVVMDVSIYEVNKSDLLQFGNQFGSAKDLLNLGGIGFPLIHNGTSQVISQNLPAAVLGDSSFAFGLPISNLVALSSRQDTKLVAQTQIHAFNNEDSSATIGQRVPVKTAQVQTGNAVGGGGIVSDIINYEQTGLTLKFKPLVFPNQDVQVAMEITSKDVTQGGTADNPIFTERTIKGTARVQNNKTLLLASVASNVETKGNTGLPLLGLLPIIGRLFTSPTRDNRQIDIVIAITPRVIRAPSVLPEDEVERPTGSQATPTNSSLEAMIIQDEIDDQIAAARRNPTNTAVQLPDQPASPEYVRTGSTDTNAATNANNTTASTSTPAGPLVNDPPVLKPIDTTMKTLDITRTSDTSIKRPAPESTVQISPTEQPKATLQPADDAAVAKSNAPKASFRFGSEIPTMKAGEKAKLAVYVDGSVPFRSAVIGLRFDNAQVAVRSVQFGDLFGSKAANTTAMPFLNQNGKMFVSLLSPDESTSSGSGVLAYIEIEALMDGKPSITFDKDVLNMLASDGKGFVISY